MTAQFKPLLAGKAPAFEDLTYPLLASPKLDGIRALVVNGKLVSRSLKPIPNRYIQSILGRPELEGLDGELVVNSPTAKDCYRITNSAVMSEDGEPAFTFYVFDLWNSSETYIHRLEVLNSHFWKLHDVYCIQEVTQTIVRHSSDLEALEHQYLELGYEGLMVRSLCGLYKRGRSTSNEGILLKVKRFTDAEATVIDFDELHSNKNEATVDNLGHTERSSHKAGLVPMNTLGALVCRTPEGVTFNIGSGFSAAERQDIWNNKVKYFNTLVKYRSFSVGVKDKPRFPTFIGFRSAEDL